MTLFAGAPLRTIEFVMVGTDASFPGGTGRCLSVEGRRDLADEMSAGSQGWGRRGHSACKR